MRWRPFITLLVTLIHQLGPAPLSWYDEPLVYRRRCAESDGGDKVVINHSLVGRKGEIEEREDAAFAERAKSFMDRLTGKLSKAADVV